MPDRIHELFVTHVALAKLAARGISRGETEQLIRNQHAVLRNLRGRPERPQPNIRRLLIGRTNGGRTLTLVIEATIDPTGWLVVTGWQATPTERRLLVWNAPKTR